MSRIEFIMADGELPSESMLLGVQKFLSDEQIRPLTDRVTVKAPETVDYKINVKYFVNQSDLKKVDTIKTAVNAAVDDYIIWQRNKIGRDINPSQLIQQMMSAGAKTCGGYSSSVPGHRERPTWLSFPQKSVDVRRLRG